MEFFWHIELSCGLCATFCLPTSHTKREPKPDGGNNLHFLRAILSNRTARSRMSHLGHSNSLQHSKLDKFLHLAKRGLLAPCVFQNAFAIVLMITQRVAFTLPLIHLYLHCMLSDGCIRPNSF